MQAQLEAVELQAVEERDSRGGNDAGEVEFHLVAVGSGAAAIDDDEFAHRAEREQGLVPRTGGIITAVITFFIGGLWIALMSHIGITGFVDTPGAVLAPLYGIVVADYYLVCKQKLNVQDLFSAEPGSTYYFDKG